MFIYSLKYQNNESRKILKNEAAEPYLEPLPNIYDEAFLRKYNG